METATDEEKGPLCGAILDMHYRLCFPGTAACLRWDSVFYLQGSSNDLMFMVLLTLTPSECKGPELKTPAGSKYCKLLDQSGFHLWEVGISSREPSANPENTNNDTTL